MVNDSEGRAAGLLDSAGPGTAGPAPSLPRREPDSLRLVRIPLCEGQFELRVPRKMVKATKRPPQDHIEGFNADAAPC